MLTSNRRKLARLCLALALIIGAIPFVTPVAAQDAEATGPLTPVEITFTTTELLDPGQEWVDAEGNLHFRDSAEIDTVSGAIEGEAVLTFDGDGLAGGIFYLTATAKITTENGGWDGHAGLVMAGEAQEYETVGAMLIGRGENAGKVIALDAVSAEDEGSITFSGQILTMDGPTVGVHLNYDLCFTGPDSASGGFLAFAPQSDAGSVTATFSTVGAPAPRLIVGDVAFQSEHGSFNAMIVEAAHEGTNQNYGYFMLMGGTGDYAGLYGWGHTIETLSFGEDGGCAGPSGTFFGEALAG